MRQIAAAAKAKGVRMVDAPVSGGPEEAATSNLVLMSGGNSDEIAEVDSMLKALSSAYHYTRGVGTSKTVKLVNNMMAMGNILVAVEAFTLGTAAGYRGQDVVAMLDFYNKMHQVP
ncbi:MAG: hypothetical protein CK528_00965 [Alcaligenaceae bacterium]|nr:MAG: hypothetical protein CK528_00965 [Alcaligenaceae bacterium]